ncbi:ATP-grasp domain-containing protein [Planktothrix sp. FACHB-1355]|uniref:ATP-grasp domain-containing protein n=1 Tax=Aerosakkonema funiforme FACHB-1375 TaxID=2949571 RepID=A0A926VC17_9CYAN|nr:MULTISPECIES: ATP-grasp domain-containing protein [Oscillatoriales]MBD2180588.1 ATP-grasp domain-containing protein [Aerosakkonema funiforme FACHB-1375]MBD3561384.1 ATP-grasp domain-containing protein [Planktothrix sp. FACHB-1355]
MRIVIVGNDLRTIALARVLLAEGHEVLAVPGFLETKLKGLLSIPLPIRYKEEPAWQQIRRVSEILNLVNQLKPDLVVCLHVESSDVGLVDALIYQSKGNYLVFGVNQKASQLETSKAYGISIARASGLSVPSTEIVRDRDRQQWLLQQQTLPNRRLVIKADGLAGGRGTLFANNATELLAAFQALSEGDVIVQEYIEGQEVALSLMCQGRNIVLLNVNFEFKRAFDGDRGPNTPGMGTVARNAFDLRHSLCFLEALPQVLESLGYCGPLDVNFMVDSQRHKPVFLEFTARFGDPELSSEILLLKNVDRLLFSVASGIKPKIIFRPELWGVGVVARGGTHILVDEDENFTHDFRVNTGGMESCFSGVGYSISRTIKKVYRYLYSSVSLETKFRKDVGQNVSSRWKLLQQILNIYTYKI